MSNPAIDRARTPSADRRALVLWLALGAAAFTLLPWAMDPDRSFWESLAGVFGRGTDASGLRLAFAQPRVELWGVAIALLVAASALRLAPGRVEGRILVTGALAGWIPLLASSVPFPGLPAPIGLGAGGVLCALGLLMLMGVGIARIGFFRGDVFVAGAVLLCGALLLLFVAFPVLRALSAAMLDDDSAWSSRALAQRIGDPHIWTLACLAGGARCGVAWNTLLLALMTGLGTTVLGAAIALVAERGRSGRKRWIQLLALLPIVTPPFVVGLGLILLFGRAGLVNQMLESAFGVAPTRWFYGLFGTWLAQMFAFTPIAFMIVRGVVQGISPSLEEAAQTLRASRLRTFVSVTLPLMKPGLANAFLVGFIESIADFGNPIVVGGQYSVLSTDIFFAIVGAQYNQGRAAALALILVSFALAAFFVQRRVLGRASYTTMTGKGDGGLAMPLPDAVRRICNGIALPWLVFTATLYAFAFAGGLVKTWGRDYTPTLAHFRTAFDVQVGTHGLVWAGTAWNSLFTTVRLAALAAPMCAAIGLLISWLLARTRFRGQSTFEFAALLAFAVPGTVLGVSYVLAFNVPPLELTGTGMLIVLCFVFRNLPLGVRAGLASFKQLDRSLDEASTMLRAGTATTLRRIVLPLLKPALVSALIYSFVRSMTTVSAVIFLVTAENELATTYIIGRVGNGDYGVALAYCTALIVLMSAVTALIQFAVGERRLGRRAPLPAATALSNSNALPST